MQLRNLLKTSNLLKNEFEHKINRMQYNYLKCSTTAAAAQVSQNVMMKLKLLKNKTLRLALAALNLKKCEVIKTAGDTNNLCVKTTLNEIDNDITQFLRMNIQRVASFDSVRFQWKAIEDSDMVLACGSFPHCHDETPV